MSFMYYLTHLTFKSELELKSCDADKNHDCHIVGERTFQRYISLDMKFH